LPTDFLSNDATLDLIGDDAPTLFFGMYYTCGDARVQMRCATMAGRLTARRGAQLLKEVEDEGKATRADFFEVRALAAWSPWL
jgi:hypothetical protein